MEQAVKGIMDSARRGTPGYVCLANVYNVMLARRHPRYRDALNAAGMVACDGMPIRWIQKFRGHSLAQRIYGPDLMLRLAERCASQGTPIALFGGTSEALATLRSRLVQQFPSLRILYSVSPPFRDFETAPSDATVADLAASGARILFVGLGTPKQDFWMAANSARFPGVMIGVGAAFDFISGSKPQAPRWMMGLGLEWLFRLLSEPRRLWRRYLFSVPHFAALVLVEFSGLNKLIAKVRNAPKRGLSGESR